MPAQLEIPAAVRPLLDDMLAAAPTRASGGAGQGLDNVATHDFAFHEFAFDPGLGLGALAGLSQAGESYLDDLRRNGVDEITVIRMRRIVTALESALVNEAIAIGVVGPSGGRWFTLIQQLYAKPMYLAFLYLLDARVDELSGMIGALMHDVRNTMGRLDADTLLANRTAWAEVMWSAMPSAAVRDFSAGSAFGPADVVWYEEQANSQPAYPTRAPAYGRLEWWFGSRVYGVRGGARDVRAYDFDPAAPLVVNVGLRLTYRQSWRPLALQRGELVRTIPLGPAQKERVSTKIVSRRKDTATNESKKEQETSSERTDTTKDSSEVVREAADSFNWNASTKVGASYAFVSGEISAGAGGASEDKSRNTSSSLSEAVSRTASKMRTETKVVVSTEVESTFEQERSSEISNPNNEIAITYEYYRLQQQYDVSTVLHRVEGVVYVAERVPTPYEVDVAWVRRHDWIIARVLKDESYRDALTAIGREIDEEQDPVGGGSDPFRSMFDAATQNFAQFTAGTAPTGVTIPDIYAAPQQSYRERLQDVAARTRGNALRAMQRDRLLQHLRDHILHYCRAIWAEEDRDQRLLRYRKEARTVPDEWTMTTTTAGGRVHSTGWVPQGTPVPLVDVIDPLGPIGYVGNYSVWALRPGPAPRLEAKSNWLPPINGVVASSGGASSSLRLVANLRGMLALARAPYVDTTNGGLLDPALTAYRREANALSDAQRAALTDAQVWDYLTYFPAQSDTLLTTTEPRKPNRTTTGALVSPPTAEQWAQYLYRSNGTRRVLMDSDNLYLALRVGEGAALEPFKRTHRYIDALRAAEGLVADRLKNERRAALLNEPTAFDPDVQKVVVTGGGQVAIDVEDDPVPPAP